MAHIHSSKSGRLSMSPYFLLLLFIVMNSLSFVELKNSGIMLSNITCINIPIASLLSMGEDKFGQLKLFTSPPFISNYSLSCGKFDM